MLFNPWGSRPWLWGEEGDPQSWLCPSAPPPPRCSEYSSGQEASFPRAGERCPPLQRCPETLLSCPLTRPRAGQIRTQTCRSGLPPRASLATPLQGLVSERPPSLLSCPSASSGALHPGGRLSIAVRRGLACPPPHIPLSSVWGSAGLPSPSPPASSFTPLGWKAPCPRAAPASPGMGRAGEVGPSTRDQHFFPPQAKSHELRTCLIPEGFQDKAGGGRGGREGWEKEVRADDVLGHLGES